MSGEGGFAEFQRRMVEFRERYGGRVEYIVRRWAAGESLEMGLDEAEPLLVRGREVRRLVERAVGRLLRFFESPEGGVEVFTVRSPSAFYGTGKSQVVYFIMRELRARGVPVTYISLTPGDVLSGGFERRLMLAAASPGRRAIFIDEVDLLVTPGRGEGGGAGEQVRLLEAFANALIGYVEKFSRRPQYRQAVVPVLSFKAERVIDEIGEVSSRLGRRLRNQLVSVDIWLTRGDVYRLFENTAILAALAEGLDEGAPEWVPRFLYLYARDYADNYWDDRRLASLPVGDALTRAMAISRALVEAVKGYLSESRVSPLLGAENPTLLGRTCEAAVRRFLARFAPRLSFRVEGGGEGYVVDALLDSSPFTVGRWRADMRYVFRVGSVELGYVVVEVTSESSASHRKIAQVQGFSSRAPTLVVHLYRSWEEHERFRGDLERVIGGYSADTLPLSLHVVKYPAILGEHGDAALGEALRYASFLDSLRVQLNSYAVSLFYEWLSAEKMREAARESGPRARDAFREALEYAAKSFVGKLSFSGGRKRRTWRTMMGFLRASLSGLEGFGVEVDSGLIEVILEAILGEWQRRGLGHLTKTKSFSVEGGSWSDGEAEAAAREVIVGFFQGRGGEARRGSR